MRILAAIIGLALAIAPAAAEPGRVVRMSDGDSGRIEFRGAVIVFRHMELDTPETGSHAKCDAERQRGDAAKAYALTLLPPGKVIDFRPKVGGKADKYGRVLGWITVDGRDYATMVIERGLGVRYDGRKKPDWCGGG